MDKKSELDFVDPDIADYFKERHPAQGGFSTDSITLEAEDPGRQPGGESLQPEAGPARPAGSLI